ncbi:replication initiation protein [Tortoise microvirus 110]|nr:replication initiation protein [Tortoise microvirus 102]QCS37497.1 replication initiation protein [Tortoise microvirus 110]
MACSHPIWIRNRRYYDKKNPSRLGSDIQQSALALRPWDVSRQWLMVPCGHCDDCLRRLRNDWFVRLDRELAHSKSINSQAVFITITISPKYYDRAFGEPAWFIRKWLERVRHKVGHSFKHAFFQEFGSHPETGSEPRLHFHGFLFGLDISYDRLRTVVGDLGFIWVARATQRRARYTVKYVVKQINYDGNNPKLRALLQHRRYTRKFVSAGLGNYLGNKPAPSFHIRSWSYLDTSSRVNYDYAIPRYYNRHLKPEDELRRSVLAADTYARFSKSPLVRHIVSRCVNLFIPEASLSRRASYTWQLEQMNKFRTAGRPLPAFDPPTFLTRQIVLFWYDNYKLSIT